jgi:hypothetical protein
MARKLEDIFDECYERIVQGESFESCLARYPEHAAELEPLLRTALGFTWRASSVKPRPAFKHWARARLEGAQHYAKKQRQVEKPGLFSWQRSWAVAVAVILVILLTGSGTVAASSDALPDETLYPVKLATEQVRVALTFSDEQKAEVHTQLAQTRATEIEIMSDEGKTEAAAVAAERLATQLEQANYLMAKVESRVKVTQPPTAPEQAAPAQVAPPTAAPAPEQTTPVPAPAPAPEQAEPAPPTAAATIHNQAIAEKTERLKQSLDESTSRSLTALENALEKAPPQSKPALQQAINRISEKRHGKPSQEPDTGAGETGDRDKNKDKDKDSRGSDKPSQAPVQPEENQPSPQIEGKDESTQVVPEPSQLSTENKDKPGSGDIPTSVQPYHSQRAPQSDNKTQDGAGQTSVEPKRPQPYIKEFWKH